MNEYQPPRPEDVLDEIIGALRLFSRHRQVRFHVLVEIDGSSRVLLWGAVEPGQDRSVLQHQPQVRGEPVRTQDYLHAGLRTHLRRLLLASAKSSALYEITVELPYPQRTLAPAGRVSWNMGRGQVLLGSLH